MCVGSAARAGFIRLGMPTEDFWEEDSLPLTSDAGAELIAGVAERPTVARLVAPDRDCVSISAGDESEQPITNAHAHTNAIAIFHKFLAPA